MFERVFPYFFMIVVLPQFVLGIIYFLVLPVFSNIALPFLFPFLDSSELFEHGPLRHLNFIEATSPIFHGEFPGAKAPGEVEYPYCAESVFIKTVLESCHEDPISHALSLRTAAITHGLFVMLFTLTVGIGYASKLGEVPKLLAAGFILYSSFYINNTLVVIHDGTRLCEASSSRSNKCPEINFDFDVNDSRLEIAKFTASEAISGLSLGVFDRWRALEREPKIDNFDFRMSVLLGLWKVSIFGLLMIILIPYVRNRFKSL